MEFRHLAIVAGELGGRNTPLSVAAFFMCVRSAKLHGPEGPGRRVSAGRRRLRQQFKLTRFDAALPVHSPKTIRSGIATTDDDDTLAFCRNRFIRDRVAGVPFVLLRQKVHSEMDTLEFTTWNRQIT